jgi:integrase
MSRDQIMALLGAIKDLRDLCLLSIGVFSGPRASEVFGLQWKSWTGEALLPQGIAYDGQLYVGRLKTKASKGPIIVPDFVRPTIEAWRAIAPDTSPDALMFPTFGRGERLGQLVPYSSQNFLYTRIRRIAVELGIPARLITFQVMRRTLGTDPQNHGTLKDAQGALRHASITTTGNVYVQPIDENVFRAVNSRANALVDGWAPTFNELGRTGRQPKIIAENGCKNEVFSGSQPGGRRFF